MAVGLFISAERNRRYESDKQFIEDSNDIGIGGMTQSHREEYFDSIKRVKEYEDERAAYEAVRKENDEKIKEFQKNQKAPPKKARPKKEKPNYSELSAWGAREAIVDFIKSREGKAITKNMIKDFRKLINVDLEDNFKSYDYISISEYSSKRHNAIKEAFDSYNSNYIRLSNGATYKKDEIKSIAHYTDGEYKMLFNGKLETISNEDYVLLGYVLRGD